MPFEVAVFFSLITILTSLPTEQYFHPWHGVPESFRIPHGSYSSVPIRRSASPLVPAFGQRNYTRARGEVSIPHPYAHTLRHHPQEGWYDRSLGTGSSPVFPVVPGADQYLNRRSSDPYPAEEELLGSESYDDEKLDVQSTGNTYSSHVNCATPNQNQNGEKRTVLDNEPSYDIPDSEGKINFEETRNYRSGTSKEVNSHDLRIVNSKGGPKRPQGSSVKIPYQRVTNTIPTTEKTFRNQTRKGTKRPRPSPVRPQGGGIVFPDAYEPQTFTPEVSKCTNKALTFCEHVGEDYPRSHINEVLKKEGDKFKEFFGMDVISDPNITERINAPEEDSLCLFRQEVVYPRAAQNKEDKWLFIVNQDQYVQGVTVEVCLNPESQCMLSEGFPLGYTSYCKQKYIERRLIAIAEDGKPHSDSFRLPSCCSCVVRHNTSARMGPVRSRLTSSSKPRTKS